MTLPDTEQFTDGNWALGIFSVNLDGLLQRAIDIIDGATGYEHAMDELAMAIAPEEALKGDELMAFINDMIDRFLEEKIAEDAEAIEDTEAVGEDASDDESESLDSDSVAVSETLKWFRKYFGDMIFSGMGAAGQDGRTVRMVCRPGLTIPVLFRLEFKPNSMKLKTSALAVYFGQWIDLSDVVSALFEKLDTDEAILDDSGDSLSDEMPDEMSGLLDMLNGFAENLDTGEAEAPEALEPFTLEDVRYMLVEIKNTLNSFSWLQHLLFYEIKPGQVCTIPTGGLEKVKVLDEAHSPDLFGMMKEMEDQ
jgi:hypothetical protein